MFDFIMSALGKDKKGKTKDVKKGSIPEAIRFEELNRQDYRCVMCVDVLPALK
jgi:hypothetical protein